MTVCLFPLSYSYLQGLYWRGHGNGIRWSLFQFLSFGNVSNSFPISIDEWRAKIAFPHICLFYCLAFSKSCSLLSVTLGNKSQFLVQCGASHGLWWNITVGRQSNAFSLGSQWNFQNVMGFTRRLVFLNLLYIFRGNLKSITWWE